MTTFRSPDGLTWRVEVRSPGASNATVIFRHPDDYHTGATSRRNRYAWYLAPQGEAANTASRVDRHAVLDRLTPADLALLYRRSMPISATQPSVESA